jgi:hypothetical protein
MKRRVSFRGPVAFVVVAVAAVTAAPRSARADETGLSICIAANEASIKLRREHKLLDARTKSFQCTDDACPALLRDACKHRIEQVNTAVPTIVFDVKDATGADVPVTVSLDGRPLDTAQGAAIQADPGEHKFLFAVAGQPPLERTFILREGEKGRREPIIVVTVPASAAPGGAPPAPTAPVAPVPNAPDTATGPSNWSTQKTLALVTGGVGVAGIAVGSVFGWMAHSSWSSSQSACPSASNCPQHAQAISDHDSATSSATIATIAFAAGAAAVAGGLVLWLTAPHAEAAGSAPAVGLGVVPGPAGAGALLTGVF